MDPYIHIRNLLGIITAERSVRRFYAQPGSPYDRVIKAAQRALIEYKNRQVVTDADHEQEDRSV